MASLYLYGLGAWLVLMILAIINGSLRNAVYSSKLGELRAHQLSTVTFVFMIFLVSYGFLELFRFDASITDYFFLGLMWTAMTVAFEFGFGHYVAGHSWEKLLADYNICKGRLWILVLVSTLFAPLIVSFGA